MHPLLARYLNLDAAADTLHREDAGQVLKAEERKYAEIAKSFPQQRGSIVASRGNTLLGEDTQGALIQLASLTAAAALGEDETLKAPLSKARVVLLEEGATASEADAFLAGVVIEEAFGGEDELEGFDRELVQETLESVPSLAKLTRDRVMAISDDFVAAGEPENRELHRLASQSLLVAAWSDGPEPLNVEHVEQAVESMADTAGEKNWDAGISALGKFLDFVKDQKLIGPLRFKRLMDRLSTATLVDEGDDEDFEDDEPGEEEGDEAERN